MNLVYLRCTGCGANIADYDPNCRIVRCNRLGCGRTFLVDDGRVFFGVEEERAQKIGGMRKALDDMMKNGDYVGAESVARDILLLIPGKRDFLAQFYYHLSRKLAGSDPRTYEEFLMKAHDVTPDDLDAAAELAFQHMELREEAALEKFIQLNYEIGKRRDELTGRLVMNVQELEKRSDDYALAPRDVFICHRAMTEGALACKLAERMEREGWTAWCSERNMRPHVNNYWEIIEYAVRNCRVFLVLSSRNAMMSADVQKEMRLAEERDCARVEWKLDDQPHNLAFKKFFDGIQWVDGRKLSETETEHLILRIFDELRAQRDTVLTKGVSSEIDVEPTKIDPPDEVLIPPTSISNSVSYRLDYYVKTGNIGLAREAIQNGDNPDNPKYIDFDGNSPVHYAVLSNANFGELIIPLSKRINLKNKAGNTPLLLAKKESDIKLLLENGANVNEQDNFGQTALMNANNAEIVRLLLRYGAKVNLQDNIGNTALHHFAYIIGDEAKIRAIVSGGANINARNHEGKTPLGICSFLQKNTKALLKSLGGSL